MLLDLARECHVMIKRVALGFLMGAVLAAPAVGQVERQRKLTVADLYQMREVSGPEISPDGAWVAYTVSTVDTARDRSDRDVWMSSWDGRRTLRLTKSKSNESTPRWSPDGRYLTFLSSREDTREVDQ